MKPLTAEECFDAFITKSMDYRGKDIHLDKGVHFVLYYLYLHSREEVCAGELSRKMNVSSARIAALLNDLEAKGLVSRDKSDCDSRKTLIRLTGEGEQEIVAKRKKACALLQYIIDEIGQEDMRRFIDISKRIKQLAERKVQNEKDL